MLRSALTLRGLCHEPTGAILAAATTSLPEELGGVRNWDYRYCWLRDAAMTARALVDLGSLGRGRGASCAGWTAASSAPAGTRSGCTRSTRSTGYELGAEAVIETLPGYAGSRPVRVGNAANRQVQLDVFGPVADLLAAVADAARLGPRRRSGGCSRRWSRRSSAAGTSRTTASGRPGSPPRHHVYSKVMCWMTVDRALHVVREHAGAGPRRSGSSCATGSAHNVLEHGWHEEAGAYTVAYGDEEMDASSLWIGLSGLLPDDDPRFLATVLKVEADLRSGPVVYRYRWDDGLPGREGGFHICTAWLVEAYLRTGRRADAEELFEQMLDCAGPTGLLPEQYDPLAERGLGNHPQAYSHLGLIRCALLAGSGLLRAC